MTNAKVCLKCKHKTRFEGQAPTACEACGAIYRKVEEAMRARPTGAEDSAYRDSEAPTQRPALASTRAPARAARETALHEFVEIMRLESLYPTWRELVKWFTRLGYAVAVVVFVMGIFAMRAESTWASVSLFIAALVVAVMARVSRELSLMVADLADAAVRTAHRQEQP